MKAKLLIIFPVLFFLGKLMMAQDLEVISGPFIDSANYVAPAPFKSINGIIPVTHYQQCGQSWSSDIMGSGTCSSTICQQGCAMTCASMLLKANGVNVDPGQLNTWLQNNSGYTGCSIYWTVVDDYPGSTMSWYGFSTYSLSTIKSEIDAGNPVLVHVELSVPCSHFVLVYGYNNSGTASGDFVVADPATSTFPTYLSDYTICTSTEDANPLRMFHNVSLPCTVPSTPGCISPGTGSRPGESISTLTPVLSWSSVSGATDYDVFIRKDPPTGPLVLQVHCMSTNSYTVPVDTLVPGAYYCWNTQANVNCNQCESGYAAPLYFNTISTGIVDDNSEINFEIFPNPNKGAFSISIYSVSKENLKIEIMNTLGKNVFSQTQSLCTGENKIDLELGNIATGVYFMKLQTCNPDNRDGIIFLSGKIIVQQ